MQDHRDKYRPEVHQIYLALYEGHKADPGHWRPTEITRVLTAALAAQKFSWRVIGITPAALKKFAEMDFKYQSGCGITRAHLVNRQTTFMEMINRPDPMTFLDFANFHWERDKTVLSAKGENKNGSVPEYISIENEGFLLFNSYKQLAMWRHGKAEVEFLRSLYESLQ